MVEAFSVLVVVHVNCRKVLNLQLIGMHPLKVVLRDDTGLLQLLFLVLGLELGRVLLFLDALNNDILVGLYQLFLGLWKNSHGLVNHSLGCLLLDLFLGLGLIC